MVVETGGGAILVFYGKAQTGYSDPVEIKELHRSYQASISGTGAVTATIDFEVSNDRLNWIPLGTITLADNNSDTDGFLSQAAWKYTRANLSAISGTGALVSAYIGV